MNPRSFRIWKGWTLKEMALRIGAANPGTVSKHELGQSFPSPDYVEKYRDVSDGMIQPQDWLDVRKNPPVEGDIVDLRTPEELERKRA